MAIALAEADKYEILEKIGKSAHTFQTSLFQNKMLMAIF